MYKGETSVPEVNLTSLIKAAESLKVRGLTSSDQTPTPRSPSIVAPPPPPPSHSGSNGYNLTAPSSHHAPRGYSPSPVRSSGGYPGEQASQDGPASKMAHIAQVKGCLTYLT